MQLCDQIYGKNDVRLVMDKRDALLLVSKTLRLKNLPKGSAVTVITIERSDDRIVYVSRELVKFIIGVFLTVKTLSEEVEDLA